MDYIQTNFLMIWIFSFSEKKLIIIFTHFAEIKIKFVSGKKLSHHSLTILYT